MHRLIVRFTLLVVAAMSLSTPLAQAETRLFIPDLTIGQRDDLQFLVVNANARDTQLDLWAFTAAGELLGQVQLSLRGHSTRTFTAKEAFQLQAGEVKGWLGAVSADGDLQISYRHIGGPETETGNSPTDALEWIARETQVDLRNPERELLRLSNPNSFPAQVTVNGQDQTGRFSGGQTLTIAPFAQVDVDVSLALGGEIRDVTLSSNTDILSTVTRRGAGGVPALEPVALPGSAAEELTLLINSQRSVGAYQVALQFDPKLVQFSSDDVTGGLAPGFESKPLVVNIDNTTGRLTIASFQVGSSPTGQLAVARLRVPSRLNSNLRFGIRVEEITDTAGQSILGPGVDVGLLRAR